MKLNVCSINGVLFIILLIMMGSIITRDWLNETFTTQGSYDKFIGSFYDASQKNYVTNFIPEFDLKKKNLSYRNLNTNILFDSNEFNKNYSNESCCPSIWSNASGCICATSEQVNFLNRRGGNRTFGEI